MNSNSESLSQRGASAATQPLRVDMDVYFEALQNRFDNTQNPNGTFPMNVAENSLLWPLLRDKIKEVSQKEMPEWVSSYGDPCGVESFRAAVADHLSKFLFQTEVSGDTLAFSSGLTSTIDQTCFILANPGEVAMIPAPAYPVYTSDIGVKAGLERFDITTHREVTELKNGDPLTVEHLSSSLKEIEDKGKTCRMLILTTPNNPTGSIYTKDQLEKFANWSMENRIHLIVNEIYGLSRIDTKHKDLIGDYGDKVEFESFAQIMKREQSPYLHLWYSFSKDLGISGFRVGMAHSYNEKFIDAYRNTNMTHAVSNLTQWTLQEVLSDHAFMEHYIEQNTIAITTSYRIVTNALKELSIPFAPSYGSLFVWMDLSAILESHDLEGERKLWMDVYKSTGILLTPTEDFANPKAGCFRMVISYVSHEELRVAIGKLSSFINSRR